MVDFVLDHHLFNSLIKLMAEKLIAYRQKIWFQELGLSAMTFHLERGFSG